MVGSGSGTEGEDFNRRRQAARRDSGFRHGMLGNASETGIALRAIDASEAPSGLKQASPAVASPPSPVGFPVSNAPRKFDLRSKGTEREAGEINRRRQAARRIATCSICAATLAIRRESVRSAPSP